MLHPSSVPLPQRAEDFELETPSPGAKSFGLSVRIKTMRGRTPMFETQYEALRRRGVSRRSFLQFCSLTAASLGLGNAGAQEIAQAMETKPRTPVVWLTVLNAPAVRNPSFVLTRPLRRTSSFP